MANITFHEQPAHTAGELPKVGVAAPEFSAVKNDLAECAASVRKFHVEASKLNNVAILCISKDLPFALTRFCAAEGIDNLTMLSDFRGDFAAHYPIVFTDSPLKGLLSRCIVVLDEQGKVVYTEQVPETTNEPNYAKALEAINN